MEMCVVSCVLLRLTRNAFRTVRQYWLLLLSMNERPGNMVGVRYVHMEVGHAARNVYLQVVSLGWEL